MPNYYTLKTEVPLLPGQTLAFTAGRGYYATGTPTPNQTTRNTTDAPSWVDQPVATPAQTQPVAANAAQVAKNTTNAPAWVDQPVATPAQTQPVAANAAQVAKNTTDAPAWVDQPVATPAQTQPVPANAAQVAKNTTAAPTWVDQPAAAKPIQMQPVAANAAQVARQTFDLPSFEQSASARLVDRQPVAANAGQVERNTTGYLHSLQPTAEGTPIPSRFEQKANAQSAESPSKIHAEVTQLLNLLTQALNPEWKSTSGRKEYAFDDLRRALGLNGFQAAALVGNMAVESRNFLAKGSPELVPTLTEIRGYGGIGIAQFTDADRVQALKRFAYGSYLPWTNFGLQVNYVAHELSTDGYYVPLGKPTQDFVYLIPKDTLQKLQASKGIEEATAIVQAAYEQPGSLQDVPPYPSVKHLLKEINPSYVPVGAGSSYRDRLADARAILIAYG